MDEPARRSGKPRLIAAAVFVALVAGGLYLQQRREAPPPAPPAAVPATLPALPEALAPLGRAEIIEAAAAAASAHAAGQPPPPGHADLVGRRFVLRLPFGCQGPVGAASSAPMRAEFDPASSTLRLHARAEVWTAERWVRSIVGARDVEAIDGFWVDRPWIRSDACPEARSPLDAAGLVTPSPQTLALAELFEAGSSRVLRRDGRPYEAIKKVTAAEVAERRGFNLVLEGDIADAAEGRPIGCLSESPDQRPVCLVAVRLDRVALEDRRSKEVYAQWR